MQEHGVAVDHAMVNRWVVKYSPQLEAAFHEAHNTTIVIRWVKYLNNVVEQEHRSVKRVTHPMRGFKSFAAAQCILVGAELMHMLRKGQMRRGQGEEGLTPAAQFHRLAA